MNWIAPRFRRWLGAGLFLTAGLLFTACAPEGDGRETQDSNPRTPMNNEPTPTPNAPQYDSTATYGTDTLSGTPADSTIRPGSRWPR